MTRPPDVVFAPQPHDLPVCEIEILPPFRIMSEDRSILDHGKRYTVSREFAADLIASGRAFDPTGARPVKRASLPAEPPKRSGQVVRVRILDGFSIRGDNGHVLGPGEHSIPVELASPGDGRMVLLDVKPPTKRKHFGPLHPIRISTPQHGAHIEGGGVLVDGSPVAYGTELEVPESLARELFGEKVAVSLKPELPDPRAEELAELIAGDDDIKRGKAMSLATMIFTRNG